MHVLFFLIYPIAKFGVENRRSKPSSLSVKGDQILRWVRVTNPPSHVHNSLLNVLILNILEHRLSYGTSILVIHSQITITSIVVTRTQRIPTDSAQGRYGKGSHISEKARCQ